MEAYCNDCFAEFELEPKIKVLKNQIHKHYFICPDCNTEYVNYYTDQRIRRDIKRNKKKRKQYGQSKTEEESRRLLAVIKKNEKLLKNDMDALEERMTKALA